MFVYCFRMSFPEINALSVGGEGEEKYDHVQNKVRKWRSGIRKIVWAVWRGMNKGNVHVTELTFFLKLSVFRAVEFFIRDKYEKKKYYDKNAIAITNVSKTVFYQLMFVK